MVANRARHHRTLDSDQVQPRCQPVEIAHADLPELIERALRGEEVGIACDGEPMVRLVPVARPRPQRRAGTLKGKLHVPESFFEPLPEEELKLWEGQG